MNVPLVGRIAAGTPIEALQNKMSDVPVPGGMIGREVFPTTPPSVEYRLSPLGRSFLIPLAAMVDWAFTHHPAIRIAREAFAKAA